MSNQNAQSILIDAETVAALITIGTQVASLISKIVNQGAADAESVWLDTVAEFEKAQANWEAATSHVLPGNGVISSDSPGIPKAPPANGGMVAASTPFAGAVTRDSAKVVKAWAP